MGKKIKKAVKKITKPVEKVAKGAVGAVGGVLGQGEKSGVQVMEQAAPPPAQIIEAPTKGDVETEDDAQTESGKKKARAGGKKSLSVARSSGGGLNI
uniref:Virion assembly protein n=1 Tax=Escherichia phage vB_EcoS_P1338 TaxID=3161150 RepID=A0AAU7VH05_9CAUD